MVDETPPPAAPGPPDRRRPAPTIDLEATEIASRPMAGESRSEASGDAQASAPAPEHDTGSQAPPASAASRSRSARWPFALGAAAGVFAALAGGAVALWVGGGNDTSAVEARVAQLESQVEALAGRVPTDLTGRVAKLESQVAQQAQGGQASQPAAPAADPALAQRIATLEGTLKTLGERVDGVSRRDDSAAANNAAALGELAQKLARADASGAQTSEAAAAAADAATATIADLTARLDALEAAAKVLASQEKPAADPPDDHALRAAIIAFSLNALVERGRPFSAELKAAQAQAADGQALAPLEKFADTGVPPNPGLLTRELTELLPALHAAAATGHPDAGFLDKLEANAERLVRIHPIEQAPGDDPAAILSRVEFKAVHGDVPGALAELGTLPDNVRAPAQGWIDKAQSRAAALAASRAFAADALAALGKPPR
jgi:hypothetical protein